MTVILDIMLSVILFGMMMLTIMNININMSNQNYQGLVEFHTQTEAIQLARIIEFDFRKIGYTIPVASRPAIQIAETSHVRFKTNFQNSPGATDIVDYTLSGLVAVSINPRDRMLIRTENTSSIYINYSVVKFLLSYYNSRDSLLVAPITGALRDSIRSVKVLLILESPEPFDTTHGGGYQYASALYQKLIYPRNL